MQDWISPEVIVVLDIAVLLALTFAGWVGLTVLQKLNALQADRAKLALELQKFASQTDAAEDGLSRLSGLLQAEAVRRSVATPKPAPEAPPLQLTEPAQAVPAPIPAPAPAPAMTVAVAEPTETAKPVAMPTPAAVATTRPVKSPDAILAMQ